MQARRCRLWRNSSEFTGMSGTKSSSSWADGFRMMCENAGMNERGEGSSTAIVAIVVIVLVAIGLFMFYGPRSGAPPKVDIQVHEKTEAPAAPPAQPAQP